MSLGSSFAFYAASAHEISKQLEPPIKLSGSQSVPNLAGKVAFNGTSASDPKAAAGGSLFERRLAEGQRNLLLTLIAINLAFFPPSAVLSYYLARKSLRPVERVMEAQSRFASDASHELRTPLANIQIENEIALNQPKLSETQARRLIASNLEEVIRLKRLAEALLKVAREDGPLYCRPVWVDEVGTTAINGIMKQAQARGVKVVDQWPHTSVMADRAALTQTVAILLDNAVKYTSRGGSVYLEAERRAGHMRLTVRDEGSGIAAKHLPYIFDRFYRADQSRSQKSVEGYGLGLSIARRLVELQGGQIEVTSTVGAGSRFTIELAPEAVPVTAS